MRIRFIYNTKSIISIIFLFGSFVLVNAQDTPEDKIKLKEAKEISDQQTTRTTKQKKKSQSTVIESDTTKDTSPFAARDTLATQEVKSNVYWYDIENTIKTKKDRLDNYAFRLDDEKQLIYRNMSDIFREKPLWYNYNLMESGRPAYISAINSFPHQTSFYYNGILMNDPIHGMFNSQYIPVNFIRNVQLSSAGHNMQDFGLGGTSSIHVVSSSKHTKAPWSKILFKQGNYGYSDLDLSFVHPATPDIAIQLGGINRKFDGSTIYNNRHGTNYRGELTWQLNSSLYLRGQFFLNRERVGITSEFENPSPPFLPRQIDLRDDYFIDLTWLPTDTISQRVHLTLFNTYSIRRLKDDNPINAGYHNRYQFKRYGFDANYDFKINEFDFLVGGGTVWNKIWGTGFNKQYFPTFLNTYGKLKIPLSANLIIKPQAQITFDEDLDPQLALAINAENSFNQDSKVTLGFSRSTRYPNATEKYFNFDTLYGNSNLVNEDHIAANITFSSKILSELKLGLTGQYSFINKEIVWENTTFKNNPERDFFVIASDLEYPFWKFKVQIGGFETFADLYVTSRRSGWIKLHYADIWLNGALGVDAYATLQYWGEHNAIKYEPRMERFYGLYGIEDDYTLFNWKIVATVQSARIFFEMDNSLSEIYEVINQYQEFTQRWRFGVHWILWD